MNNLSLTYRLIAVLTGFMILVGICFPTGLQAKNFMSEHCELPLQAADAKPHEDCAMAHHADASHHSQSNPDHADNANDCELEFTCACSIAKTPVKPQAVQLFSKIFAGFYPLVVDYNGNIEQSTYTNNSLEADVEDASPPLFLKHSAFLN